jgi:hypothetical protein
MSASPLAAARRAAASKASPFRRQGTRHRGISYRERADGSRTYFVTVGSRHLRVDGGEREALLVQADLRSKQARGLRVTLVETTFAELAEEWFEIGRARWRRSTENGYRMSRVSTGRSRRETSSGRAAMSTSHACSATSLSTQPPETDAASSPRCSNRKLRSERLRSIFSDRIALHVSFASIEEGRRWQRLRPLGDGSPRERSWWACRRFDAASPFSACWRLQSS